MSKAKSIVVTVFLALVVAVAAFFAVVSFPFANNTKRLNSIASNIHMGAEFTGYAYTTIYPKGVITAEEYGALDDDAKSGYTAVGGLFVESEKHEDIDALKESVSHDAAILSARFGKKGYSSYSVAVEDGVSIKVNVPTNYTYAAYNKYASNSTDLSAASSAISTLTAYSGVTLRTTDTSILLVDADDNSSTYDTVKKGSDDWVDKATVNGSKTYSLTEGDANELFKSVTSRTVGSASVITFNLTKSGAEKFKEITTLAASSSSQTIYFFVGNKQLIQFNCTAAVTGRSLSLQTSDATTARNAAITMNSAISGGALSLEYEDIDSVVTSSATLGNNAALFMFIACVLVLAGVVVFLIVKYKKLGAITALVTVLFALVELYALMLLNIQVTFTVILAALVCLALFTVSNAIVFAKVKEYVGSGRIMQAAVKDGYKSVLMTITDLHIVLVIVAILLATVAAGEVAACGLIAVIGVIVSYVLYWFNRFMWYVVSSPVRDKYSFAGLKKVVYEDD